MSEIHSRRVLRTPSPPLRRASIPLSTVVGHKRAIWPLVLLLVLVHLSAVLYTLPLNRVIELRLCQAHYELRDPLAIQPDGSIPEKLCKIDDVQRRLAWLQGTMETTLVVCGMWVLMKVVLLDLFERAANHDADTVLIDFIVTIPFSFVAERWGVKIVLLCNLVPRIFMSAWAMLVGMYSHYPFCHISCNFVLNIVSGNFPHILPTNAIIAGPFLNVLGGECVFQSTIFTLTSALASEYVERYVNHPVTILFKDFVARETNSPKSILLLLHQLNILHRILSWTNSSRIHHEQ